MIDGTTPDPQPGPAPPGDLRPRATNSASRWPSASPWADPAERVARAAIVLVERLPVPAGRQLGHAAEQDVRAQAVAATWRAACRSPAGFLDAQGAVNEPAVMAYLAMHLRKGIDELHRQRRVEPFEDWHAPGRDETVAAVLVREAERELSTHVAVLPAGSRVVLLARQTGWSYRRIADMLDIRRNTAIQRYRRSLQRIPEDLHRLLPEPHQHGA